MKADERHELLANMFPSLSLGHVVGALRMRGGDAQRASLFLTASGCTPACTFEEVSQEDGEESDEETRVVSDEDVTRLVILDFDAASAAAALRRNESVDDAAMWLLDSPDRGLSAAAADARKREMDDRTKAERTARRALAANARVPEAVLELSEKQKGVDESEILRRLAAGFHSDVGVLEQCCVCGIVGKTGCRGCGVCGLCTSAVARCPALPNGGYHHAHRLSLVATGRVKRSCDICRLICQVAWRCLPCDFDACPACVAVAPPHGYKRTGHGRGGTTQTAPIAGSPALLFYEEDSTQSPRMLLGSNRKRVYAKFEAGTIAREAAARWDNDDEDDDEEEQVLVDEADNSNSGNGVGRASSIFSPRRQLGCGVMRDVAPGTHLSDGDGTGRSPRFSSSSSRMSSKRRRLARGATGPTLERKIGHDETAVLVDFYGASSDKSATRLSTAEMLLAESNRIDVAGRRALESALALADLDLASQLLLGSLRAAKRSASSSSRRNECCAVCFGSEDDGKLEFICLGGGHALHAACAADLALGGGDCPSCRAPIFYAGVARSEVAAAKNVIDEETRKRSATSTLRPGDCVKISQDLEECRRIMSSPENGGWYSDMDACCGKHAVVATAFPDKGTFDVKIVDDAGSVLTWRLDKKILTLSLAGGGSAGTAVTTESSSNRPNDDHDSTLSFVRECSRRLRVELVAVKRCRDALHSASEGIDSSSSSESAALVSPADVRRGKHLVENLCSDSIKGRIRALVDSGDLDSAARAVRRDNAASLSEAAVWADAVKPGTYRVAKETWLDLRTRPESNAPRTGYRLNPGTVFVASRHRLGSNGAEQKDLWLQVGEVLVDSRKQPDGTSSFQPPSDSQRRMLLILESAGSAAARSTSSRRVWSRGDDVLFSHLPDSIGARVVRGRDWTFGNQDGRRSETDPLPLGEILGPARPRGAVRVRWLGRDYANDYHAGVDLRCDLKYAADAPAELPKPQGWVRARIGGPGTRFAVKPVFKSLRCCACGDDLNANHEQTGGDVADGGKKDGANTTSEVPFPSPGQEALVAATLERVKIVSVESESRKHCVCTFPGEEDVFDFRTQDLVPARSLESISAPEEDDEATVEYQGLERTRRELVLAVDGDLAKARRIWAAAVDSWKKYDRQASSLERATCVRGHPMHARCFQGRLVAGLGCPVCDEPLWIPPVRRLGTADDECNNSNHLADRSAQEQRPASEPLRRIVRLGENCVFRLVSSEQHDDGESEEEFDPRSSQLANSHLQYSWSGVIFSEVVQSVTVNLVVERDSSHMTVSVNDQPARAVGWVPVRDLDALSQLASATGATIQGNAIRPDAASSSPSQILRMCPVCYSGPLANEQCADLRAHHMQCSNCPARVPYADTRLAEALSQLAPSTPVGECIPRCHACNARVTFNGCMQCGKLFASMSWEALPKWDPMAKARLESVQRERNEMRALANEVRTEAALLEHERRDYLVGPISKTPALTSTKFPHRFWYEPPLPPAFFPGNTKPLQVSCEENCTLRHLNGDCLVCGLDWGEHSGHNCPDGQRGSWFLDYTEEEDD